MTTFTLTNKLSILQIWLGKLQAFWHENIQIYERDTPKWLIRQWKREAEAEKTRLERRIREYQGWLRNEGQI